MRSTRPWRSGASTWCRGAEFPSGQPRSGTRRLSGPQGARAGRRAGGRGARASAMAHVPPVRAVECSRCGDRPRVRRASGRKRRGDGSAPAVSARSGTWADVVDPVNVLDVGVGERAEATATARPPDVFRPLAARRAGSCVRGGGGVDAGFGGRAGSAPDAPTGRRMRPLVPAGGALCRRAGGSGAAGARCAHPVRPLGGVTVRVGTPRPPRPPRPTQRSGRGLPRASGIRRQRPVTGAGSARSTRTRVRTGALRDRHAR